MFVSFYIAVRVQAKESFNHRISQHNPIMISFYKSVGGKRTKQQQAIDHIL
jgi:hypothetical protein